MWLSFSHLIYSVPPKSIHILLKRNAQAFWDYFVASMLVLCKVLEPNKHFNWQMGSRICDGFIGHHNRYWDFPLDLETTRVCLHLPVLITLQTPYTTLVFHKKKGVTLSEPYWMLDIAAVRLDHNLTTKHVGRGGIAYCQECERNGCHSLGCWCLQKNLSLCSYTSLQFLFHLTPLLTCTSIHCMLLHVLHCGVTFETVSLSSTSILWRTLCSFN